MMSPKRTLVTARRVLRQLRHDHRTVALLLVTPALLLVLIRFIFDAQPAIFDHLGLMLLGVLPFTTMFLVTSIAMLRERTTGTLERLLTTPLAKLDLLLGYGIAFATAAAIQSSVAAIVAYGLLGLDTRGSPLLVGVIAIANAVLGTAMGLLVSAFAHSEFQAAQFMPVVVMPQALLCGLIAPRDQMAGWLHLASDLMPMTYAVEALNEVGAHREVTATAVVDLGVIVVVAVVALSLGAATLRRRTA
jgi:ABC-2 type transport system permease protein